MRIFKLTDTWEVVRDTRCLFCMEKRQNHVRMNSENESKEFLRELWQEKPGWKHMLLFGGTLSRLTLFAAKVFKDLGSLSWMFLWKVQYFPDFFEQRGPSSMAKVCSDVTLQHALQRLGIHVRVGKLQRLLRRCRAQRPRLSTRSMGHHL